MAKCATSAGAYWLTDHSLNGTSVNGDPARIGGAVKLSDGDIITVGSYIISVSIADTAKGEVFHEPDWSARAAALLNEPTPAAEKTRFDQFVNR